MSTIRTQRFNLIELIILVSIVAVALAIAVPKLISAKLSANEVAAVESLIAIKNAQTIFNQRDIEQDGKKNYWTLNAFGLYAIADSENKPIKLLQNPNMAHADISRDRSPNSLKTQVQYATGYEPPAQPTPSAGYFIAAIEGADRNAEFSFCALPERYGRDGKHTFIVNQTGIVYSIDAQEGRESGNGIPAAWPGASPEKSPYTNTSGVNTQQTWRPAP